MKPKKKLTKEELEEKLSWLRQQRDGLIEGNYRNYLARIYSFIKSECEKSPNGFCNPYPWQCNDAAYPYESKPYSKVGLEYCRDLEQLGYISIVGYGADKQIRILKPLDF